MTDNLFFGRGVEDKTGFPQKLILEVFSNVSASDVRATYSRRNGEAFVHGHGMGDTITDIKHRTSRPTSRVER